MTKRRDLYIVSTNRKDLYELLKKRLSGRDDVEIVLDRRAGERRTQSRTAKDDRRRGERRTHDERHYLLKSVGIIHVSAPRRATARG